jgi:hypothetical protein
MASAHVGLDKQAKLGVRANRDTSFRNWHVWVLTIVNKSAILQLYKRGVTNHVGSNETGWIKSNIPWVLSLSGLLVSWSFAD